MQWSRPNVFHTRCAQAEQECRVGPDSMDGSLPQWACRVMRLMSSPDFQALVSDVMGGSDEAKMAILEDPRKAAMLDKFATAMRAAGIAPPAGR